MANATAETIIGHIRTLLREESGSDLPVVSDAFLLAAISDGNLKWAEAFQGDGAAPIVFQRETGFALVSETAVNDTNGITSSSTSITVDSHSFPDSSGAAVVWDDNIPDIFEYTGSTATSFTGVTGLAFTHEDNDEIQPLYMLPVNFGDFREAPGYGDGVRMDGIGLSYTEGPPDPGFFSMYDNGTSKFLWLPRGSTNAVSVWYDKNSTTIDSTDDTVDVPTTSVFFLVWHGVAFCYIGREQDWNKMIAAQTQSNIVLQRALRRRNKHPTIRARSFGRVFTDYTTLNGHIIPLR